ncbi:MAG: gliding motility protein GldN, partial [Crocinitomicaceae bacterium]|nr:gliding motility protein GldN [Crocinitomicaceae bacterium]
MPGPQNFGSGIIDGVVMKEAVITKAKVPYQYVREADYVWSKRVYSRID